MSIVTENGQLVELFNSVMSSSDGTFQSLLTETDLISAETEIDTDLLRGLALFSLSSLRDQLNSVGGELGAMRHQVDTQALNAGDWSIRDSVDALEHARLGDLTSLGNRVGSICSKAHIGPIDSLSAEKQTLARLLDSHAQLGEYVDLPNLAESCIASGYYMEAVDLFRFAKSVSDSSEKSRLVDKVSSRMSGLETSMMKSLEAKLSGDSVGTIDDVTKIISVLQAEKLGETLPGELVYLMARIGYFEAQKLRILKRKEVNLREYAILIKSVICEEIFPFYHTLLLDDSLDHFLTKERDAVSRFILNEIEAFRQTLIRPTGMPYLFERGNLLVVKELHACIVIELGGALRKINCDIDLNQVFVDLCVSHFIEPRLRPQSISAVFASDLKSYDWQPNNDTNLMRHKPLALLYNQIINVLNELRHFPLTQISSKVIDYVDIACAQCFEQLVSIESNHEEHKVMIRNYCFLLVPSLEKCLNALFTTTLVDLVITKSHERFLVSSKS